MPTQTQAIVTDGCGHFALETATLCDPEQNEVLVEIHASSGVCHTDFDALSYGRHMTIGHESESDAVMPEMTAISSPKRRPPSAAISVDSSNISVQGDRVAAIGKEVEAKDTGESPPTLKVDRKSIGCGIHMPSA